MAIVHHWFVTRGGGERVAECIAALFPSAEIFTLVATPAGLPETLRGRPIHTSFLQRMPMATTHHRHFLPLYPAATESLDLRGFDLVLTSDSGPVKGVRLSNGAMHVCYCHSPMRYLWDGYEAYREGMRGVTRAAFSMTAGRVKRWDTEAAKNVDWFVANSRYVAERIRRCYGREAEVLQPPIDLHRGRRVAHEQPGDHYLCAGRLVPYKRTEILIEACRKLGRKLRIAGAGPEMERLKRMAEGDSSIEFLGELPTEELWREYARCRALLFAADEDFGMVPLEAQACGRPVIAYGMGGSLETIRGTWGADNGAVAEVAGRENGITGLYFAEQTAEAAAKSIELWESRYESHFLPGNARGWASGFATPVFLTRYREMVLRHLPAAAEVCVTAAEAAAKVAR